VYKKFISAGIAQVFDVEENFCSQRLGCLKKMYFGASAESQEKRHEEQLSN